tara:strand:+ start:1658 stop:2182 length:525 start_codon:yes stop_codon:yes gene_type:complete
MKKSIRVRINEAKREKKPHCEPKGKWHDKDGQFSTKKKARSWSGSNPSNKTDCSHGQSKSKGGGERQITSLPCGRAGDKSDPNIKAKHRCYDGAVVEEEMLIDEDGIVPSHEEIYKKAKEIERLNAVIKTLRQEVNQLRKEKVQVKAPNMEQLLKLCNAMAMASDGELNKKDKK